MNDKLKNVNSIKIIKTKWLLYIVKKIPLETKEIEDISREKGLNSSP